MVTVRRMLPTPRSPSGRRSEKPRASPAPAAMAPSAEASRNTKVSSSVSPVVVFSARIRSPKEVAAGPVPWLRVVQSSRTSPPERGAAVAVSPSTTRSGSGAAATAIGSLARALLPSRPGSRCSFSASVTTTRRQWPVMSMGRRRSSAAL